MCLLFQFMQTLSVHDNSCCPRMQGYCWNCITKPPIKKVRYGQQDFYVLRVIIPIFMKDNIVIFIAPPLYFPYRDQVVLQSKVNFLNKAHFILKHFLMVLESPDIQLGLQIHKTLQKAMIKLLRCSVWRLCWGDSQ